jgi:B3 DNA binding domain
MHVPAKMDKLLRVHCHCGKCRANAEQGKAHLTKETKTKPKVSHLLPTRYRKNFVVRRCELHIKDDERKSWPVTYEVLVSSGQRHHRFTKGWTAFCRAHNMGIGDEVALTVKYADYERRHVDIMVCKESDCV